MSAQLPEEIASYPFWYHRLDLGGGAYTPGEWDLNQVVDRIPWPDVAGKRCLDIATFDGFYAFELERRGAAEVVAVDIASWDEADLAWDMRTSRKFHERFEGTDWKHGRGFAMAREALGSKVEWRPVSIYALSPETVGTFDVVTCGSLMLHLRDPVGALEAVRTVCGGVFMSVEAIDPWMTVRLRGTPAARFQGQGAKSQYWNPNSACHVAWLESAGFEVVDRSRPFVVPRTSRPTSHALEARTRRALTRLLSGMSQHGVLHRAAVARPKQVAA
jgi:tRNA (mo5U34)-methyltransferase